MRVPTVRVKHLSGDGSMLINVSDLADHHEMLPLDEQDDGFDPSVLYQPLKPVGADPAIRDFAAGLMLEMIADRRAHEREPWSELSPEEQLEVIKGLAAEYATEKARRAEYQQQGLEERLRHEASQTPAPEATDVPDQVPNTNQMGEGQQPDQSGADNVDQSGQQSGQSEGQTEVEEPKLPVLKIESSRGYFYVVSDTGEKVSKGHREIEGARSDLEELVTEGKGVKLVTTEAE